MTLSRRARGEVNFYIGPRGLSDFDLVLSYTGGGALDALRNELGARVVAPLYGHVDLEHHRPAEPREVYRSDLGLDGKLSRACQHPDNLWSLHGLHECLIRRGEKVEAALIRQRLDLAVARAEIPIKASCFCRRVAMAAE